MPSRLPLVERPRINRSRLWLGLLLLVLLVAGLAVIGRAMQRGEAQPVGLFTTLPILWNESADVAGLLDRRQEPHWARAELARRGPIAALDTLGGPDGPGQLARLRRLVIAQPRPLGPAENVALDDWVRGGGQLLLLADPALTAESAFAVGDPRRPQAVVLLSPILKRWGLELRFDDGQPFGERRVDVLGTLVPTNLAGHWAGQGQGHCRLWADGLAVTCAIGQGRVVALADAAVLDADDPDGARRKALAMLLDAAFAAR